MAGYLGVIGGLSPYSTILYYKFIVEMHRERTGKDPRLVIISIPVQEMCYYMKNGDLSAAADLLGEALHKLEQAGVDVMLIAANTPHILIDRINRENDYRFVDIRDAVYERLESLGVRRVGLIATKSTIESGLYEDYLLERGIVVVSPSGRTQDKIDELIESLTRGVYPGNEKLVLATAVSELVAQGAEAIVYGCTELSLLVNRVRFRVPLVDSLTEHVRVAVRELLREDKDAEVR